MLDFGDATLILIGFKGVGKSTLGAQLAERLGRVFYDTDHLVAQAYPGSLTVREIVLKEGPEKLVELEREVIRGLREVENAVIATGGGAPLDKVCAALLNEIGMLIHLTEDRELVRKRILSDEVPTFIDASDPHGHFEKLFSERITLYNRLTPITFEASALWQAIDLENSLR